MVPLNLARGSAFGRFLPVTTDRKRRLAAVQVGAVQMSDRHALNNDPLVTWYIGRPLLCAPRIPRPRINDEQIRDLGWRLNPVFSPRGHGFFLLQLV